jgi:GH18 family chitinase
LLTAFVPSDEELIDSGYAVYEICKYLDYVTVETYGFTGSSNYKITHNSPLYSKSQNSVVRIYIEPFI